MTHSFKPRRTHSRFCTVSHAYADTHTYLYLYARKPIYSITRGHVLFVRGGCALLGWREGLLIKSAPGPLSLHWRAGGTRAPGRSGSSETEQTGRASRDVAAAAEWDGRDGDTERGTPPTPNRQKWTPWCIIAAVGLNCACWPSPKHQNHVRTPHKLVGYVCRSRSRVALILINMRYFRIRCVCSASHMGAAEEGRSNSITVAPTGSLRTPPASLGHPHILPRCLAVCHTRSWRQ